MIRSRPASRCRNIVVGAALLAALLCASLVAPSMQEARAATRTAEVSAPVALVYRGPGSCSGCSEAVAALIAKSPRGFAVRYVGPNEALKLTPESLQGVALYAQPGGDGTVAEAERRLGASGMQTIRDYVAGGGHYVGFCMGAYLAGSNPGMELLAPGDTGQYIRTAGASVTSTRNAVIPIKWRTQSRYHFAQDPAYIVPSGVAGEVILSRFSNNRVNALARPYGTGGVGVVGTHPEATRSWYSSKLWSKDKDKLDAAQGLQLIEQTMRF